MSKLRFAVCSESPDVYARVAQALISTGSVELAPALSRGSDLVQLLGRSGVDGVYVDLGRQPEALLQALEAAPQPRPALLFGASEPDVSLLLRAMQLQPLDFLLQHDVERIPARVAQLANAPVRGREPEPERHGVIAVSGSKGGVGATFVTCELAASLQRGGERVAVLDLNLRFGDAALYFDLRPPYTLVDVAKKGEQLDSSFLETALATHLCGVRVLAGPSDAQDMGMIGGASVERAIKLLRDEFDWVLIDLPYGWDDIALRALNLVDEILLVSQVEVPALRHTNYQLELLEGLGAPQDRVRVVVNRFGRQSPFSAKELESLLGRPADFLIPEDSAAVSRCVNEGKLLHEAARGSRIEQALLQLADRTREWVRGEESQGSPSASWAARIRSYVTGD